MSNEIVELPNELTAAVQPYIAPAIVHELNLETRAGSPLGGDPRIDPLGLDPAAQ